MVNTYNNIHFQKYEYLFSSEKSNNIKYIYYIQEVLFALCGFCFYIGFGANGAANKPYPFGDEQKALVAMCFIASLSFLVDFVFGIINLKNEK